MNAVVALVTDISHRNLNTHICLYGCRYSDCTKVCEMRSHLLFPSTTSSPMASIDLSRYEIGSSSYLALTQPHQDQAHIPMMTKKKQMQVDQDEEDPYQKYVHLLQPQHHQESLKDRRLRMIEEERQRQMKEAAMASAASAATGSDDLAASSGSANHLIPAVDCVITAWSPWSDCSATCGRGFRRKFRMIKRHHSGEGEKCPRKLERRQKCELLP